MPSEDSDIPLPFSRKLPAEFRPVRHELTLPDGYRTALYIYIPRGKNVRLRDPVVYLHGIQSHPGWFCGSAAILARAGHPVFLPCRRGSGDNTQNRGHAPSAKRLLDDVDCVCRFAREKCKAPRVRLVGVSWGGKLATAYALGRPAARDLACLTLVAPGIVSDADVRGLTKLGIGLCWLVWPRKRFRIPLDSPRLFTDNGIMQQYIARDPYSLHRATARFLCASKRLDFSIRHAGEGSLKVATTLLLGARDRIVDNVHTRKVINNLTAGHAHVEELNAAHTIEFESNTRQYYGLLHSAVER